MELIFFALMLVVAAILFPEGMRAFVLFTIKWTAIGFCIVVGLLIVVGLFTARGSVSPVQKVSTSGFYHKSASVIVLDDGTKLDLSGGWYNASGDLLFTDEEDAERVRLYREGLAAMQQ